MPDGCAPVPRLSARILAGGRRLHLSDGPIDLVIEAWGQPRAVAAAYYAATRCMGAVLDELCAELPALRAAQPGPTLRGPIALCMQAAVRPHAARGFITPMAAVAGSVADHVLAAMTAAADLERAYVNNGGDIALHLESDASFAIGIVGCLAPPRVVGTVALGARDGIGGVATSGWSGRSHSLGIADAVTVLAKTAAAADAAATVIANAVDLPGHPGVWRVPAKNLVCDSDLGERLVTCEVAPFRPEEIATALGHGMIAAERLRRDGLIAAAFLHLQGETRITAPAGMALQ